MSTFLTAPDSWATCHLPPTDYHILTATCWLPTTTATSQLIKRDLLQFFFPPEIFFARKAQNWSWRKKPPKIVSSSFNFYLHCYCLNDAGKHFWLVLKTNDTAPRRNRHRSSMTSSWSCRNAMCHGFKIQQSDKPLTSPKEHKFKMWSGSRAAGRYKRGGHSPVLQFVGGWGGGRLSSVWRRQFPSQRVTSSQWW